LVAQVKSEPAAPAPAPSPAPTPAVAIGSKAVPQAAKPPQIPVTGIGKWKSFWFPAR